MSFIYKMKSNGPNMDPCGTPQEISLYNLIQFYYILHTVSYSGGSLQTSCRQNL